MATYNKPVNLGGVTYTPEQLSAYFAGGSFGEQQTQQKPRSGQ